MRNFLKGLFFFVFGCGFFALGLAKGEVVQLTEKDQGRSQSMRVGDILEISLEGNPTTGYIWELAKSDTIILIQKGEPDYQASTRLMGSGGMYAFRFEAIKSGESELELIYHRTFEKDTPPIKIFKVRIIVQNQSAVPAD